MFQVLYLPVKYQEIHPKYDFTIFRLDFQLRARLKNLENHNKNELRDYLRISNVPKFILNMNFQIF